MLKVTIPKNKVGPPRRKGELTIYYDEGLSMTQELLDYGLAQKVIERGGAWYSFPIVNKDDPPKAQGGLAARELIASDLNVRMGLENSMRQSLGLPIIQGGG
jgi:recombination protein RecA